MKLLQCCVIVQLLLCFIDAAGTPELPGPLQWPHSPAWPAWPVQGLAICTTAGICAALLHMSSRLGTGADVVCSNHGNFQCVFAAVKLCEKAIKP